MGNQTYQQRSNQDTRIPVSQRRMEGGKVLEDNRAAFNATPSLGALKKNSPLADQQAQLAAMSHSNPTMTTQRNIVESVDTSPLVTTQRQRLDNLTGGSARQLKEELLPEKVESAQRIEAPAPSNNTGLPDKLKNGIESLSGLSMDNVKVHYNSAKPAQLNALAYAQGTDIHVGPGQEKHLPHEAWHVVQQAQGRVKPTMQMKDDVPVNDDKGLEQEADLMGGKAVASGYGCDESNALAVKKTVPENIQLVSSAMVVQRVIKGLEEYTEAAAIPDTWVEDFIADLNHPHAHLNQDDILLAYRQISGQADFPAGITLVNAGGDHWDVRVGEEGDSYMVKTRHDGNCGVHVAAAINAIRTHAIEGAQEDYQAGEEVVTNARAALNEHYSQQEPDTIKAIIAGAIKDKATLPEAGFGPRLNIAIEATGKIDDSEQRAAMEQIAKENSEKHNKASADHHASPSGIGLGMGSKGSGHHAEKHDSSDEKESDALAPVETMHAYLMHLREIINGAKQSESLKQLGAELAYGFHLIGDDKTAQQVLAEFGHKAKVDLSTVKRHHPQLHLAVVLTHVLEHIFNSIHSETPFKNSRQVAKLYAGEITKAFSLANNEKAPEPLGPHKQLPPKTIAGVLARGESGGGIYLGHNAKGQRSELRAREKHIEKTAAMESLSMVSESVIGGSLTEDERHPLNCAECVPITSARKNKLTVETDDVYPLSLHTGSHYQDIATCANCQTMYGIEDRETRRIKQETAEKLAAAQVLEAKRLAQSRNDKALAAKSKVNRKALQDTFTSEVKQLYNKHKKTYKGVAEHDLLTRLPIAQWIEPWANLTAQEKEALVVKEMATLAEKAKAKKATAKK